MTVFGEPASSSTWRRLCDCVGENAFIWTYVFRCWFSFAMFKMGAWVLPMDRVRVDGQPEDGAPFMELYAFGDDDLEDDGFDDDAFDEDEYVDEGGYVEDDD